MMSDRSARDQITGLGGLGEVTWALLSIGRNG